MVNGFHYKEWCCYITNCSETSGTTIKVPKQTVSNTLVGLKIARNKVYSEKLW